MEKVNRRNLLKMVGGVVAGLAVGGAVGYFTGQTITPKVEKLALSGNIPIGVLASDPIDARMLYVAADIAVEDVNDFWKRIGIDAKLVALHENAEESATKAVERTEALIANGCKLIIGPTWSSHLKAMRSITEARKILVISPTSSSGELCVPKKYIYRIAPPDPYEISVHVAILEAYNIKYLIMINTTDSACASASAGTIKMFEERGGKVIARFQLDPEAKEFSAEAALIADKIKEAIDKYGKDAVGVMQITLVPPIPPLWLALSKYPVIYQVKWIGCGSNWGPHPIIFEQVPDIAAALRFPQELWGYYESDKSKEVFDKFKAKAGYEGINWVPYAYDAVWLGALSLMAVGKYDGELMDKAMRDITKMYFGASGRILFDENGDRSNPIYDVWMFDKENGKTVFKKIAYVDIGAGYKLVWLKGKQPEGW